MTAQTDKIRKVTTELSDEMLVGQLFGVPDIAYRSVPYTDDKQHPTWRLRFDLTYDSHIRMGLDVNGEVALGRGQDSADSICLFNGDEAEQLGVSRRHAMLRPTENKLYIIDLGSTNGTWLNGRSIGVNMPNSLANGDILRFGRLEVIVQILKRPSVTPTLHNKTDVAEALSSIARAITSQLDVKEVLKQAIDMAMLFTPADEIAVWLVDEQTGELFLEAGKGVHEGQTTRLPLADTLAGKVIKTGKSLRANREGNDDPIKLKTNYLVEAVIYVPLTLAGVTVGVMSAAHREKGKSFQPQDERLMSVIADLASVAVHNARLYHASERSLALRTKLVTAVNYALSHDLKNLLNSIIGYAGILGSYDSLDTEMADIATQITAISNQMAHLFGQLVEVTTPTEDLFTKHQPCDLDEEVTRVIDDLYDAAAAKSIVLDFQLIGEPYLIYGDAAHLYRSIFNLVDNAVRYSPKDTRVLISVVFGSDDILIRVQDSGPGIPEADLPHLFERFFRSRSSSDGLPRLGLGLELVRATVEAHRGTITAHSIKGQGAEFIMTLPGILRM